VVHALLLPVVTTQSVPLALTCKVSPVAKIRLYGRQCYCTHLKW
jgi:hypothetical protein